MRTCARARGVECLRTYVQTLCDASLIAKHDLQIVWVKSSDQFDAWALGAAMRKGRALGGG